MSEWKCIRNMNYFLSWKYECCCINKLSAWSENRILFMCYFQKDPEGVLNHNQIDMHAYILYRICNSIKRISKCPSAVIRYYIRSVDRVLGIYKKYTTKLIWIWSLDIPLKWGIIFKIGFILKLCCFFIKILHYFQNIVSMEVINNMKKAKTKKSCIFIWL